MIPPPHPPPPRSSYPMTRSTSAATVVGERFVEPRLENTCREPQRTPTVIVARRCCDDQLNPPSTHRFATPSGSTASASPARWEAKVTFTITPPRNLLTALYKKKFISFGDTLERCHRGDPNDPETWIHGTIRGGCISSAKIFLRRNARTTNINHSKTVLS